MSTIKKGSFTAWWRMLERLASLHKFPLDIEHKYSYQEYFDDGCSPAEVLEEEGKRQARG